MSVFRRRLPSGRPSPSYYYRFAVGPRRIMRGGYVSRAEALDAEVQHRAEVGRPPPGVLGPPGFATAARRYLLEVVAGHVNPRTARHAFALLIARWGDRPLRGLTVADVDDYRRWRAAQPAQRRIPPGVASRPVAGSTVNRELAALSGFFRWAADHGWLADGANPARSRSRRWPSARGVVRYEEPWRPWQALSAAQEAALWPLLPPRERVKVQLLLALGVRKGVVLGLRWEQLDLTAGLLTYRSKGRSGVVPLSARALALLRGLGPQARGPVFPERSDTGLRRAWATARVALGLPTLRLHDLRVTVATRLARAGVDVRTVQALLGHATPTMTLRYTVSDLAQQRRALALLDGPGGDTPEDTTANPR